MPRLQSRKRRADEDEGSPAASPEPETQRRRTLDVSDEEDYGNGSATQGDSVHDMSKKMVRFALACEYQRKAIRRADISDKVLGPGGSRQFKKVFSEAQLHLRSVFGMEMVELPSKEKVTLQQKRAAQKSASQNRPAASSWILRSILPNEFKRPDIISPPAAPTKAEESTYTAVYTMLVTLIGLSGGTLPDAKMERYLRTLRIDDRTPVDGFEKTELLLKRMEKDGYVIKVRESTGTGEDDVYWVIGPRGKTEIGREGAIGLVKAVYGDQVDEDAEEDLDRKITRSLVIEDVVAAEQEPTQQVEGSRRRPARKSSAGEDREEEDEDEDDED